MKNHRKRFVQSFPRRGEDKGWPLVQGLAVVISLAMIVWGGSSLVAGRVWADFALEQDKISTFATFMASQVAFFDDMASYETSRWWESNGWSNGGAFDNGWRSDHITHVDEMMTITLDDEPCPDGCSGEPYASGEYRTTDYYGYGCYEARFQAAPESGVVTSFFTFAGPSDTPAGGNGQHNEIEIEILGNDTTRMQANFWTNDDSYSNGHEQMIDLGFDAAQALHNYAFKWSSTGLDWYVDGQLVHSVADSVGDPTPKITDSTQRIMMNMWPVNASASGWAGTFTYPGAPVEAYYDWIKWTPGEDCSIAGTVVDYTASNDLFANPERGFYHHTETHSDNYSALDLATLQNYRQSENITLILRLFYLDEFVPTGHDMNSEISQSYLAAMQTDFDTMREAGIKAVVRFAYTNQVVGDPPETPYGDASKAQMLAHLAQVEPLLQANHDVIAVVQAGLIGIWGEWYYTDHFVADAEHPETITATDYANRGELVAELLSVLPSERMVQLRTPLNKQQIYGTGTGSASASAPPTLGGERGGRSNVARTGYHNDCFLASDTDFGTYANITEDKAYLEAETLYLPMGGETCNVNPPRSQCATALTELAKFHWSYLNTDYNQDVLDSWDTGSEPDNCLEEVKQRLGYRLRLVEAIYSDEVQPGDELALNISLQNDGWAAPFNPRLVELLLRDTTTGQIYDVTLPDDPRFWLADDSSTYSLNHTICMPASMPLADYELLLNLPDPESQLYLQPEYAIRLANDSVWEASTGYNDLSHTISVNNSAESSSCNSASLTLAPHFYVDDDYTDATSGWKLFRFASIQDAIDAAAGSTINVAAGSYTEPIALNNNNTIMVNGNVTLNANLTISTGSFIAPTGSLTLTGHFAHTGGTFTHNNGTLIMAGSSAQTISGESTFYNLTINNSNGEVSLTGNQTINKLLTLSSGLLKLGSNTLTLAAEAEIEDGSGGSAFDASKMIIAAGSGAAETCQGQLRKRFSDGTAASHALRRNLLRNLTFPLGDDSGTAEYSPITINFTTGDFSSASVTLCLTDAESSYAQNNQSLSPRLSRYWSISQSGISSFTANITATYIDADVVGDQSQLYTLKNAGETWSALAQADSANNELTGTVSSFSDISAGNPALLAVEFASFTATSQNETILVEWQTVSEFNHLGFNLYRRASNSDGEQMSPLNAELIPSQAPGSGQGSAYQWRDEALAAGTTYYYWLEDVNVDGTTTRHASVSATASVATTVTVNQLGISDQSLWRWILLGLGLGLLWGWGVWIKRLTTNQENYANRR